MTSGNPSKLGNLRVRASPYGFGSYYNELGEIVKIEGVESNVSGVIVHQESWADETIWNECNETKCTLYISFSYETGNFMLRHEYMYYQPQFTEIVCL